MKKKISLYDCISKIESNTNYSKMKEEASLLFIMEQIKKNPCISIHELICTASQVGTHITKLFCSSDFQKYLKNEADAALAEYLNQVVDAYYTDPEFERSVSNLGDEDKGVMSKVIIPYTIKSLIKRLDIDYASIVNKEGI